MIQEIKDLNYKYYFFVDDNICNDENYAKDFFRALIPLKIKWIGQASISIAHDVELLNLMKTSGCFGILIGFESLNGESLKKMNKSFNLAMGGYDEAVQKIHHSGIKIYATFVFGYGDDDEMVFKKTYDFVIKHKFFMAAFNHLVPFPGTPLYQKFKQENRLIYDHWWLEPSYSFGQIAFKPKNISPSELEFLCYKYRRKFYSWRSIMIRAFNFKTNCSSLESLFVFLLINIMSKIDVKKRQGLSLGKD